MESVQLKINEHMTSVGEDILCVLEKQQSVGVELDVRVFVLERLSMVAKVICSLFQRETETLHNTKLHTAEHHRERSTVSREMASKTLSEEQRETDQGRGLLYAAMQPVVKLYKMDQSAESSLKVKRFWSVKQEPENHLDINLLHLPVCKEEVSPEHEERGPSLVQEEPQPPHIKDEQEELLQRPEVAMTLLAVKSEDDDKHRETEAEASTSTEHMITQDDVEDCGTSQPTGDEQLLSPHCSDVPVGREETREGQSAVNTLDSHKTQHVEEQTLSSSHKLSQYRTSSTQTHSMKSHTCADCGKMFSRKASLKKHTIVHTGDKSFACNVCAKGFSRLFNLKTHMRTHTGGKPFTCKVCGKCFRERGNLKRHLQTHTGEKPFNCKVCAKGFSQMINLKKHMRTHTGEKPFSCNVCAKGFSQMFNLKTHMRTHTGERPFSCKVCDKGFSGSGDLKTHMRTHTGEKPFKCKVCGKGFSQSGPLKSHMMTHTGEKPFSCYVCAKGFSQTNNLKTHMRTHTGEKPFTCKVCSKGFCQSRTLKSHMRTHTGD